MVCGVCLRRVSFIFSAANEDMTTKRVARASAAVPHEASFEAFFYYNCRLCRQRRSCLKSLNQSSKKKRTRVSQVQIDIYHYCANMPVS
jgi:hypothetical protein